MKFGRIERLILFGGSWLLAEFSVYARRHFNIDIIVFSSKRHLDERVGLDGSALSATLENNGITYYDSEDINGDKRLIEHVTPESLGIAMGASWVFEKETVDIFAPDHLVDFMGIDLPRYRGGAHYTWQILHGNRKGCANIQIIRGGEETFHRGEILKRLEYSLPDGLKRPVDFFEHIVHVEIDFLKEFLEELSRDEEFELMKLDESASSYYPFLYTLKNGLINWSWSGKDICLFICAFDMPYPGASTFLDGRRVFLRDCELLAQEEEYHPFTSGLVVRKHGGAMFVAAAGNLLRINAVTDEEGNDMIEKINPGDRLYTPSTELDKAMGFHAIYDSKGVVE